MGIDGIGSGRRPPLPVPAPGGTPSIGGGASGPGGVSRPFSVGRSAPAGEAPGAAEASEVSGAASSPLDRLRAGTLTLDGYLDAKVDAATAHLALSPAAMESVRSALRERLASDPTLVELVRAATGAAPPTPHDE